MKKFNFNKILTQVSNSILMGSNSKSITKREVPLYQKQIPSPINNPQCLILVTAVKIFFSAQDFQIKTNHLTSMIPIQLSWQVIIAEWYLTMTLLLILNMQQEKKIPLYMKRWKAIVLTNIISFPLTLLRVRSLSKKQGVTCLKESIKTLFKICYLTLSNCRHIF